MRYCIALAIAVLGVTADAQSESSFSGTLDRLAREISYEVSWYRPSCYVRRYPVTGDFRNHFQNRIDAISQPRVNYYRSNSHPSQKLHENYGMAGRGMEAAAGTHWRRAAYLRGQAAIRDPWSDQLANEE